MKVTISFKNLEHTEALDERIQEKSERLQKYFAGATNVRWTCYVKEGKHVAEVKCLGPTFDYHATAATDCLYKSFDKVVQKIEKQVCKKKSKWKDHIHHKHDRILKYDVSEDAPNASSEDDYFDETIYKKPA